MLRIMLAPKRRYNPTKVETLADLFYISEGIDVETMFMVTVDPQFVEVACDPEHTLLASYRAYIDQGLLMYGLDRVVGEDAIDNYDPSVMYGKNSRKFLVEQFDISLIVDRLAQFYRILRPMDSVYIVGKSQAVFKMNEEDLKLFCPNGKRSYPSVELEMPIARDLVINQQELSKLFDPISASRAGNHLTYLKFKTTRLRLPLI